MGSGAKKLYYESDVKAIADRIREVCGTERTMTLSDMASLIPDTVPTFTTLNHSVVRNEVHNYLQNVTYDPSDYSDSMIATYVTSTSSNYPEPIVLDTSGISGLCVVDMLNDGVDTILATGDETKIYNLTPGYQTWIFGLTSENKVGKIYQCTPNSTLKYDKLRMLRIDGVDNVRDLGGWKCDGGNVKYGKLFRGGALKQYSTSGTFVELISDVGKNTAVNLLKIEKEIDLRFTDDLKEDIESGFGSSVELLHVDMDWFDLAKQRDYGHIKKIFDPLMDWVIAGNPVYFHCSAGADRTGQVALLCEGMLGVAQTDCDKDYEITSFYSGVSTDAEARRRNETPWKTDAIAVIETYPGDTFRDKVISYMEDCGISIDKINAFRKAMSTGTPDTITSQYGDYNISKALTSVTGDNSDTKVHYGQPYDMELTPKEGYIMNVKVTMGGHDVTSAFFDGKKEDYRRSVNQKLTNCTSSNSADYAIDGQSFYTKISANSGYLMFAIKILMNGVDISGDVYANGEITIQSVTGAIDITATAEAQLITRSITKKLTSCTLSNSATTIQNGAAYKSNVTANEGYVVRTVTITMDGSDVSSYYSDGVINIPAVTGDLVITATATAKVVYTNQLVNAIDDKGNVIGKTWWKENSHYTSHAGTATETGINITGLIPCAIGDTIRIRYSGSSASHQSIKGFKSDYTPAGSDSTTEIRFGTIKSNTTFFTLLQGTGEDGVLDFVLKTLSSDLKDFKYLAFTLAETDINNVIITVNETID